MYYSIYCRLGVTVYASNMAVLRAARKRMHPAARRGRAQRDMRHKFYRALLAEHDKAFSLVTAWRL